MLPFRQPDALAPTDPALPDRTVMGALMSELDDLLGNRDGLWHNESTPAGSLPADPVRSVQHESVRQAVSTGWSKDDEAATLSRFVATGEQRWGGPVTALDQGRLAHGWHFVVHKTLLLARMRRTPATVLDTHVRASGRIGTTDLPPRELRVRVFQPTAPPSGGCVVFIPGHAQPTEASLPLIEALNAHGHAVVGLAHPWTAGLGPVRGLGLMRDVAAVLAAVQQAWGAENVVAHGRSVGAGVGLLGALVHATRGTLTLDGPPLRPGMAAFLEAPWPGHRWLECEDKAPPTGVPTTTRRPAIAPLVPEAPVQAARATQQVLLSDLRVPPDLLARLAPDLHATLAHVADGVRPTGPLHILACDGDPLANIHLVRSLADALGASLQIHGGATHLPGLDPTAAASTVGRLHAWLTQAPPGAADTLSPTAPHGAARDRSLRFSVLATRARAGGSILPHDAHEPVYLTVPGLYTERYPGYMRAKNERLAALGLDHHMVPIDTDATIEDNARAIQQFVFEHTSGGRRAIVLGHSKGGVDIAAALAFFPALRPRVRAVITLQAPWLGTPIADLVGQQSVLAGAHRLLIEGVFKGDEEALLALQVDARARFVQAHPWPTGIPAVSFASMLHTKATVLAVPDAILLADHGPSDGFVPAAYAILPGSDAVLALDIDHAGIVLPSPIGHCAHTNPGDLTTALIALALEAS